ncbi:hypothetical protein [Streptomyces caelestis]|uniref:hypothetical protein n=1 Tax=Streptomyces caelestis TaxID=36816 RepID=UPI00370040E2
MPTTPPGRLFGSGRRADGYEAEEAWVLRREREGGGGAAGEGAIPAGGVRFACWRGDDQSMVIDPTMLQACLTGTLDVMEAGSIPAQRLTDNFWAPPRS